MGVEEGFLATKVPLRFVLGPLNRFLDGVLATFEVVPWWIMFPLPMPAVYLASNSVQLVMFVTACPAFLAIVDHYDHVMQRQAIIFGCAFPCVLFGVAIGNLA